FVCYARVRAQGRALRTGETVLVLGLYLCALNSKEMALTLPLALVAWELWCAPRTGLRVVSLVGPIVLAGVLNLVYLYGKVFGPDPILNAPGYRAVITMHQFFAAHRIYMDELFLSWGGFSWRGVVGVWLLMIYV